MNWMNVIGLSLQLTGTVFAFLTTLLAFPDLSTVSGMALALVLIIGPLMAGTEIDIKTRT